MSTNHPTDADASGEPSYFHSQRAMLVGEIAQSMDAVLTNLNRLNRGLEAVIAVGNEFSSVEALWSTFEGVMGDQPAAGGEAATSAQQQSDDEMRESGDATQTPRRNEQEGG